MRSSGLPADGLGRSRFMTVLALLQLVAAPPPLNSSLTASCFISKHMTDADSICGVRQWVINVFGCVRAGFTLMPLVSSSSKEPMSKASAAFTSPLGGIKGGEYCGRRGRTETRISAKKKKKRQEEKVT